MCDKGLVYRTRKRKKNKFRNNRKKQCDILRSLGKGSRDNNISQKSNKGKLKKWKQRNRKYNGN